MKKLDKLSRLLKIKQEAISFLHQTTQTTFEKNVYHAKICELVNAFPKTNRRKLLIQKRNFPKTDQFLHIEAISKNISSGNTRMGCCQHHRHQCAGGLPEVYFDTIDG